jgi:hypothetical protein
MKQPSLKTIQHKSKYLTALGNKPMKLRFLSSRTDFNANEMQDQLPWTIQRHYDQRALAKSMT